MKNDELKKCFCGEMMIEIECDNEDSGFRCESCGLTITAGTHSDAYEAMRRATTWNTRPEPKPTTEEVCPDCIGVEYQLGDDPCEKCNGTGKTPKDDVREAFEKTITSSLLSNLYFSESLSCYLPRGANYHNLARNITRRWEGYKAGYNSQKAEIERLEAENKAKQDVINKVMTAMSGYAIKQIIADSGFWRPKENN